MLLIWSVIFYSNLEFFGLRTQIKTEFFYSMPLIYWFRINVLTVFWPTRFLATHFMVADLPTVALVKVTLWWWCSRRSSLGGPLPLLPPRSASPIFCRPGLCRSLEANKSPRLILDVTLKPLPRQPRKLTISQLLIVVLYAQLYKLVLKVSSGPFSQGFSHHSAFIVSPHEKKRGEILFSQTERNRDV